MFRLHPEHRPSGQAYRDWEFSTMPGSLAGVIERIFAGAAVLVALEDTVPGWANGLLVAELDGYSVELRGRVLDGWWTLTLGASATPIESTP